MSKTYHKARRHAAGSIDLRRDLRMGATASRRQTHHGLSLKRTGASVEQVMSLPQLLGTSVAKALRARHPTAVLCHRYKLAYFPIPKVASSTIKRLFAVLDGRPAEGNPHFDLDLDYGRARDLRQTYADYHTFTIVRNPWDRLVSCYTDKIAGLSSDPDFAGRHDIHSGFLRYNRLSGRRIFSKSMSFAEFVGAVSWIPDLVADEHFRSQYRMFTAPSGQSLAQTILRFEDFPDSLDELLSQHGAPPLRDTRRNSTARLTYATYYDNRLKRKVARRYRRDINQLGYAY